MVHEALVENELMIMVLIQIAFCCCIEFGKLNPNLSTSLIPSCHIIATLNTETICIINGEFQCNRFFLMAEPVLSKL